jgi:predicted negative regulator of RcsB-dependent stress response
MKLIHFAIIGFLLGIGWQLFQNQTQENILNKTDTELYCEQFKQPNVPEECNVR